MTLVIEVQMEDLAEWIYGVIDQKDLITDKAKDRVADWIEETMRAEAPLGKTGMLRASITSEILEDSIRVYPNIYYAPYVEGGTGPSPGRYVPLLRSGVSTGYPGARLVRARKLGIHPGTPAQRFIEKTYDKLVDNLDDFIERYITEIIYPYGRKIYG